MRPLPLWLLPIPLLLTGCGPAGTVQPGHSETNWTDEQRELYHGIPVTVRFAPAQPALASQVWAYLEGIDTTFNDFRDDSEVGRLNRMAARRDVEVSAGLAEALRLSQTLFAATDGAFDVTVGPLRRLWRAAEKRGQPPSAAELADTCRAIGLEKVHLAGRKVTLEDPQTKLDFGGVVKGMAVDRAVEMLRAGGARAALAQVGGETAVFGLSPRGRPHVLGIQHPRDPGAVWTAIRDPGSGLSVSTSGNYQQPLLIAGREYYHIFDPKTGQPVSTRTLSASVVFRGTGKNGLADGLATACVVLGAARGVPLVEKLGGEALILEEQDGRIVPHKSAGWDKLVERE